VPAKKRYLPAYLGNTAGESNTLANERWARGSNRSHSERCYERKKRTEREDVKPSSKLSLYQEAWDFVVTFDTEGDGIWAVFFCVWAPRDSKHWPGCNWNLRIESWFAYKSLDR
jgi:hypothetical protein